MRLEAKHHRGIAALMATNTVEDAANVAGVSSRTLWRWLKDDTFRQALAAAETELLSRVSRSMAQAAMMAVIALRTILADDDATNSERIQAARVVLSSLPTMRLLSNIETRLQDLEHGNIEQCATPP